MQFNRHGYSYGEHQVSNGHRPNLAVERDSPKAALLGALRASRSGCPSLLLQGLPRFQQAL